MLHFGEATFCREGSAAVLPCPEEGRGHTFATRRSPDLRRFSSPIRTPKADVKSTMNSISIPNAVDPDKNYGWSRGSPLSGGVTPALAVVGTAFTFLCLSATYLISRCYVRAPPRPIVSRFRRAQSVYPLSCPFEVQSEPAREARPF